jgi:regulator of protease activity HflC (stomatin/prohibitin superfamily)
MKQRYEEESSGMSGGIYTLIVAAITLVTAFIIYEVCTVRIDPNERGVKTRFGVIVDFLEPGLHWVNPMVEKVKGFLVDNQSINNTKHPANTYTVDSQEVNATYELIYRLPGDREGLIYIMTNATNYESQLDGAVINRLKIELGKINATSLAKTRGDIVDNIFSHLTKELSENYKIKSVSFRLLNVDFTDSFRAGVNTAAQAKAKIETEANILLQEEKIADQKRVKAEGEAKAYKLKVDAEAAGHLAIGLAKAQALEAEGRALQANPRLVEYEQAKRWTGSLPQFMGVGALPFMSLDTKTISKMDKALDGGLNRQ